MKIQNRTSIAFYYKTCERYHIPIQPLFDKDNDGGFRLKCKKKGVSTKRKTCSIFKKFCEWVTGL